MTSSALRQPQPEDARAACTCTALATCQTCRSWRRQAAGPRAKVLPRPVLMEALELVRWRQWRDLTRAELARYLGLSYTAVLYYETSQRPITNPEIPAKLLAYCAAEHHPTLPRRRGRQPRPPAVETDLALLPEAPGAWLLCCGLWGRITTLPVRCRRCATSYLEETEA